MHQEFRRIGDWIGTHIKRQYPLATPASAAKAFVNFIPRDHHAVYEQFQMDCMGVFLRAYICSVLERHPNRALRGMIAVVQGKPLPDFLVLLRSDELPLTFSDRKVLEEIIMVATEDFESALEEVAAEREDAKTILIAIISWRGKEEPLYRIKQARKVA